MKHISWEFKAGIYSTHKVKIKKLIKKFGHSKFKFAGEGKFEWSSPGDETSSVMLLTTGSGMPCTLTYDGSNPDFIDAFNKIIDDIRDVEGKESIVSLSGISEGLQGSRVDDAVDELRIEVAVRGASYNKIMRNGPELWKVRIKAEWEQVRENIINHVCEKYGIDRTEIQEHVLSI